MVNRYDARSLLYVPEAIQANQKNREWASQKEKKVEVNKCALLLTKTVYIGGHAIDKLVIDGWPSRPFLEFPTNK